MPSGQCYKSRVGKVIQSQGEEQKDLRREDTLTQKEILQRDVGQAASDMNGVDFCGHLMETMWTYCLSLLIPTVQAGTMLY